MSERILIAGIGNIFMGDDAFGVEVVRRLSISPRKLPDEVRVVDFGIRGIDLAYALMDGYEVAILVDATPRGGVPGTLYTIEPDLQSPPAAQFPGSPLMDAHSMEPATVLNLVRTLGGQCNRVLVVGCEPETLAPDEQEQGRMGLSEAVDRAAHEAVGVIHSLVAELVATNNVATNENPKVATNESSRANTL